MSLGTITSAKIATVTNFIESDPMTAKQAKIEKLQSLSEKLTLLLRELNSEVPHDNYIIDDAIIQVESAIVDNNNVKIPIIEHLEDKNPVTIESRKVISNPLTDIIEKGWGADHRGSKKALTYGMFPIKDQKMWNYYCQQECSTWSAKELDFPKDKKQYLGLKPRYQELFEDMFGFFIPADGQISKTLVFRFIQECETYEESIFFISQLNIELVHSESYGMSMVSLIPDPIRRQQIFDMVDNLPCVQGKSDFMDKYAHSRESKAIRFFAAAISEGLFFVTLFAIIFYFRDKGILQNFVFMNEQISKDETLHRDADCELAVRYGIANFKKRVDEMVEEALKIEDAHIDYLLRKPVESEEADETIGLTKAKLKDYARNLMNQILTLCGFASAFVVGPMPSYLKDINLSQKVNFYEGVSGNYKRFNLEEGIDWSTRAGIAGHTKPINPMKDYAKISF